MRAHARRKENMKLIIDYSINKTDIDLILIDQKINVENFKGTEEEIVLLDKTVKAIKNAIENIQNNY